MKGFVRVAAVTPKVQVAAPAANARALVEQVRAAAERVFEEGREDALKESRSEREFLSRVL